MTTTTTTTTTTATTTEGNKTMDLDTLKVLSLSGANPLGKPTIVKDSYLLASSEVDPKVALELAAAQSLDQQIKECKVLLDEGLKRIRAYGEAERARCAALLGGNLLSVKIPYLDAQNSERAATVTCSRRYTVKKGVIEAEADLGEAFALFSVQTRHVLTDKGLDVLRGLLARSGLTGKQIDSALEQMCEVEVAVSAVEDFDERAQDVPADKADLARSFVTRAAASVRL